MDGKSSYVEKNGYDSVVCLICIAMTILSVLPCLIKGLVVLYIVVIHRYLLDFIFNDFIALFKYFCMHHCLYISSV